MKTTFLKTGVFALLAVLVMQDASAQRAPRRRTNTTQQPAAANSQEATQQNNDYRQPSGYDPYAGIPIRVDSSGMLKDSSSRSLRNDNAFDKSYVNDRIPLGYENLRWDDALYAEKVWRELDFREKMNHPFQYASESDHGNEMFVSMLLRAVNSGEVTAFVDERFTTPMTGGEIQQKTSGTTDTVPEYDVNDINKIKSYVVTRASFDPKSVTKIRIKEEWVFDREASRMFVRILGIAPLKTEYLPNGQERGSSVMFWVYYPDLRSMLAKAEVYNPKNMGQSRMTWEELFESRMFSSYIVKSTLDNASNRMIKQSIKDPILALLEGENIKEKIFNYEQDLWSY